MLRVGNCLKRALAGLLVLLVILLPAANASVLSSVTRMAAATILIIDDGEDRASTAAPHRHSGVPCDDREHPDNLACCLFCGYLVGDVPSVQPAARPSASASLHFLMFSAPSPDGLTSAPDLPPPRHVV